MAERMSRPRVMEIISSISDRPRWVCRFTRVRLRLNESISIQVRYRNGEGDYTPFGFVAIFAFPAIYGRYGSAVKPLPHDRDHICSRYARSQRRDFINAAACADHRADTGAALGFGRAEQQTMP